MSRAVRAETRSRAKEDIKRVICAIDKVRKWEKKWVSIGEATMKVYKWVPVANQETRTLISSRKTLLPRRENFSMLKKLTVPGNSGISSINSVPSINPHPPNEDSNMSQDSSNQDSQDNQINMKPTNQYACELSTEAPEGHMTTSSQSEEEHRTHNKNINWTLDQTDNSIYIDENTRASQGSNYGEEGDDDEEDEVTIRTQDDEKSSISFGHQLSSNNIPDPADGDSDIRLAMSIVGGDEDESKTASVS